MNSLESTERWASGILLAVALLTFFFPLATLQIPILGNQSWSGYDVFSRIGGLEDQLSAIQPVQPHRLNSTPEELSPQSLNSSDLSPTMPISVRALGLVAIEIALAFGCTFISLVYCFGAFRATYIKMASLIGSLSAIIAVLHLAIANSDLHSWFQESMRTATPDLANNPFAGLATQIGSAIANSVQIKPGIGLFALAGALVLVAFLSFTRILIGAATPVPDSVATVPQEQRSNGRLLIVTVVATAFLGVFAAIHYGLVGTDTGSKKRIPPVDVENHPSTTNPAPPDLSRYYAVYKNSNVRYLRSLFNDYLAGGSGQANEFALLNQWDKSYYESKFIVLSLDKAAMGGSSINILFQDRPDRVFNAWVYQTGDGELELRAFDSPDNTDEQMAKIRELSEQFLADKKHAL